MYLRLSIWPKSCLRRINSRAVAAVIFKRAQCLSASGLDNKISSATVDLV
jgi:hypothetical protein